jgi:nicotinamide-nucleotide adenylyltransferase
MIRETLFADQKLDERRVILIPVPDTDIHHLWTYQMDILVPRYDRVYTNDPFTKYLFSERGIEVIQTRMYKRRELSATEVRTRMVLDKDWKSLVSSQTAKFILDINGVERIKSLLQHSKMRSH